MRLTTIAYIPSETVHKGKFKLSESESHHLTNVLRARVGDVFIVTDGRGRTFWAKLTSVAGGLAKASIITDKEPPELSRELPIEVDVGVGIIRPQRFERMLDAIVQLGVHSVYPLVCRYSEKANVLRFQGDNEKKRLGKIAVEAMKQSLRTVLPDIFEPVEPMELMREKCWDTVLFGDSDGLPTPPYEPFRSARSILALVGPEGGFSHREKETLTDRGAVPINLGGTRLRTETAAVVFLAKLLVWRGVF